jgi:hypothetical protein
MQKMDFIHKCPLSHLEDGSCVFAMPVNDTVHCKAVFGWWHDQRVEILDKCFIKMKNRDKLLWRNRQIKILKQKY